MISTVLDRSLAQPVVCSANVPSSSLYKRLVRGLYIPPALLCLLPILLIVMQLSSLMQVVFLLLSSVLVIAAFATPAGTLTERTDSGKKSCYCLPSSVEVPSYATCDWCCSRKCLIRIQAIGAVDVSTLRLTLACKSRCPNGFCPALRVTGLCGENREVAVLLSRFYAYLNPPDSMILIYPLKGTCF